MKEVNVRRCRLCASEEKSEEYSDIFNGDLHLDLERKIKKLLPVVVMPWDPMPHLICRTCIENLNSFNNFYETSLDAEKFFKALYFNSAETEKENIYPIIQSPDNYFLKKDIQSSCTKSTKSNKNNNDLEFSQNNASEKMCSQRTLDNFIVCRITSTDSVFTCRKCFRIFTKYSSALTHSCDCDTEAKEVEALNGKDEDRKCLPPLKIRFFSKNSDFFVCNFCQSMLEDRGELNEHIKTHFSDGQWDKINEKAKSRKKRKSRSSESNESEAYSLRKRGRRKRKKSRESLRSETPNFNENPLDDVFKSCQEKENSEVHTQEESTERTSQYSEAFSEAEVCKEPNSSQSVPVKYPGIIRENEKTQIYLDTETPTYDFVCRAEESSLPEADDDFDEVTVLEVINNKTPNSFSSCVFCDKIFATKSALVSHQNKHLRGYSGLTEENSDPTGQKFTCSVCAMAFTSSKVLMDHEKFHLVDANNFDCRENTPEMIEYFEGTKEVEIRDGIVTIKVTADEFHDLVQLKQQMDETELMQD